MDLQMTVVRDFIYGATSKGADFHELCKVLGINPDDLNETEKYINWEATIFGWDYAVRTTEDKFLGLHLGESFSPSTLGATGYLMQNMPNLKEAVAVMVNYLNIVCTKISYSAEIKKDLLYLNFDLHPNVKFKYPEAGKHIIDFTMAGVFKILQVVTNKNFRPEGVNVCHGINDNLEYERVFKTHVNSGSNANCLILNEKDFNYSINSYNKDLSEVLKNHLEYKKSIQEICFSQKLVDTILQKYSGSIPAIETIASHLNITVRTLQRRLASENKSFRSISNEVRMAKALQYLQNPQFKITEVADKLGYADSNAFRRAFRSWMKVNPKRFQQSLL